MKINAKLEELGWKLPPLPSPLASYVPARRSSNLIFISGQLPFLNGNLVLTGKLGRDISIEDAKNLAHIAVLNGLSAATTLVKNLDDITAIIRLGVYVSCVPDFEEHHLVANGASDTLLKIFGDIGFHSRFAVGVPSLPLDSPIELEIILEASS